MKGLNELTQLGLDEAGIDHLVVHGVLKEAGQIAEGRVEAFVAGDLVVVDLPNERLVTVVRAGDFEWIVERASLNQVVAERAGHATNDDVLAEPIPQAGRDPNEIAVARHQDEGLDLRAIEHASSAIVVTGHRLADVAHPLDASGLVIPAIERRRVLAVSFASRKFAGRAPAGASEQPAAPAAPAARNVRRVTCAFIERTSQGGAG